MRKSRSYKPMCSLSLGVFLQQAVSNCCVAKTQADMCQGWLQSQVLRGIYCNIKDEGAPEKPRGALQAELLVRSYQFVPRC